MEEIEEEFESTKKIVEEILRVDKRSRNNDLWLILMIWQKKQHIDLKIDYNDIPKMINPETIRRMRQVIQNDEENFLPDDPMVLTKRRIREDAIRKYFKPDSFTYQAWQQRKFGVKVAK